MKKLQIASALMMIHGAVEILGLTTLLMASGKTQSFGFALPYLQNNLSMVCAAGAIFGVLRIIGAVGVLKNKLWGLAVAVVVCTITLALMIFMLPMGIADGVLASVALVLLLSTYFGGKKIVKEEK